MEGRTLNVSTEITADNIGILVNRSQGKKIENTYKVQSNNNMLTMYKKENKLITYLNLIIKRGIDILAGIVGIILIIPLTITIYMANLIFGDRGPIFYRQERIGKDGRKFHMLKYRSMILGADEKLEEYLKDNEEARNEYKRYKKLKNDPRITHIGKFLRKTSLDEMPQLLNVLNNSMSLVGPRPYLPREKEDMGKYYEIIIQEKPRNYRFMAMWKSI